METKNKRSTLEKIRRSLWFRNSCYVDPEGMSGGLALWWSDDVVLDVRFKSKNVLRCVVSWPQIHSPWLITFVYAPPIWNQRLVFWNFLKSIAKENGYPWLCVGDLNDCGSQAEKQGGNPCSRGRIEQFHSLMSDCEFMDLEFKGPNYTWSNNQGGDDNIRIRLDRALADVPWRNLFPLAQVTHELKIGSDHCPLVVNCRVPLRKVPFIYKFESMWTTHPECRQVIEKGWEFQTRGSDMFRMVQKLKNCKEELIVWSKRAVGHNKLRLKALQDNLKSIQAAPFSPANFEKEKGLLKEIEILLLREEMYLHQRSRINWLSYGDKNSAFFHASINQRRQRNQLIKLQSSSGHWIEDFEGINEQIADFFSSLFAHSGSRDFSEVISEVDSCITEDMNASLIRTVSDEEIKSAVFQLGSLKAPGPDGYPGFFFHTYWSIVEESICKAGEDLSNFLGKVVTIAWFIWKSRNEFIFNVFPINPEATMKRALEALREYSMIKVPNLVHRDNPTVVDRISHWGAPDHGCFKINCDVVVGLNGKDAKVAVVLRDWRGSLVDGLVGSEVVSSPLQGELLAIRRACGMAKALNLFGVTIESDNQTAIKLSVSELVPPWEVLTVVLDIREFVSSLGLCLAWVKREANELAHVVASNAVRGNLPVNWISFPPRSVSLCLCKESFSLL
ncbi:hypothetical protein Vadar_018002 [Vaccinium darrowii]|uniref:Uncharacterized protein n=1 Tax=Vaccinium darrowii TaxID=229202 RepID=A0ACB7XRH9_9ERIC|nr:hypothetical protein Vadar_018002 [Vaccinium darrowii]